MMERSDKPLPFFAVRGSAGLSLVQWDGEKPNTCKSNVLSTVQCRVIKLSKNGNKLAWCDGAKLLVMDTSTRDIVATIPLSRTYVMDFSPDENLLCTWEPYAVTKEFPKGTDNLRIWNISTGQCLHQLVQKKINGWQWRWLGERRICAKLFGNSVHFFKDHNFGQVLEKCHIENLESFEISPNINPPHKVAFFVRGTKGGPSSVRIFKYPNFNRDDVLAHKSFFKADSVTILWNKKGTDLLVRAAIDVDTTGESYYGEQSLHFMSCNGETTIVTLSKKGPIYDAAWASNSTQFCVVFGFMPAKACIFDLKCNQIFEFGSTPKNECYFNPQGNLLALAGFGNLRGNIEIWDFERKQQVAQFTSPDTTYFDWCSDGAHFITATTSPRLRVGNGYKLWHFTGGVQYEHKAAGDIHEVRWQPMPEGTFPAPIVQEVTKKTMTNLIKASKPASYVPPHARGKPGSAAKFVRDDEEPTPEPEASKSAKKRRRKKQGKNKGETTAAAESNMSSEQQDAVQMAKYLLNDSSAPQSETSASTLSVAEKQIKKIKKKLLAIEKLKIQQNEGKQLEKDQIVKINTEAALIEELKNLEINSC